MSNGTIRQFPVYAEGEDGYGNPASIDPIANGETVDATVLNRPVENMRGRGETIRGVLEDLMYLADADRALIVAGPGTVTWPGSTTAGSTGIFTLSDTLYILPALTPGSAQTAPVPPVGSNFGSLALTRATGGSPAIGVASLLRGYEGGDKINITVVSGSVYSCVLADETTMSIVITATASTNLSTIVTSLDNLLNSNGDNVCNASLINGALGTDLIERPQGPHRMELGYDAEGHALTPAQLAAFFGVSGNELAEGDSLCIQYSTLIDESPATDGGRRQSLPENSNTSVTSGMLFNSRVYPDRLVNAIPICKVVNGRLCFISGQQIPAGASGFDLGAGLVATALTDFVSSVVMNDGSTEFSQGAHVGLTFAVNAGTYWMNGQKTTKAADSTVLADASTNYVYIDTDGDLKDTTTLSTAATLPRLLLYRVVTAGGAITTVTDLRRFHTRLNSRAVVTVGAAGDFATLEGAIAWVGLMAGAGEDAPFEIVVQDDVTMTATITLTTGVKIRASTPASGHINTPSGVAAFSVQSGTVNDVIFEDIDFDVPTTAGSSLIDVGGSASTNDWELTRCHINGGRDAHAIEVVSSSTHSGWKIRSCEFSGMAHTVGRACVLFEQMSRAVIRDNKITCGTADALDAGILVMYDSHGNVIENNRIDTGGLAIAVTDDNFAASLTAVSMGNRVLNNHISGPLGNAIQMCGDTILDGNYIVDCDPGSSTNGVVAVFGNGGPVIIQNNYILDWPQGAAVEFNDDFYGSLVSGNVFRSTLQTADHGLYDVNGNTAPMTITGNVIDLSGQAVPTGSASAVAISMASRVGTIVSGNMFRGVGTNASQSAGMIVLGASPTIVGNIFNYCWGTPFVVGATPVIAGNQRSNGSTGADVNRLDNAGAVCHYGFQREEALAPLTGATITLNADCSTLFIAASPPNTTHNIIGLTGGRKGRRIEIWNTGTTAVNVNHQDAGATAADRIITNTGAAVAVAAGAVSVATWDDNVSRWRFSQLS